MGTKGKRLENPMDLFGKPSVYVKRWERPCAVAFLVSMQFKELASLFREGIFEYTKEQKLSRKFTDLVRVEKSADGLYHPKKSSSCQS